MLKDKDDNNKCNKTFIFHVRRKCRYLVAALIIMLNSNPDHSTVTINWGKVCVFAAKKLEMLKNV